MFSLTLREQFMVAGIICALVTGAAVKHWRDARREMLSASATPGGGDASPRPSVP